MKPPINILSRLLVILFAGHVELHSVDIHPKRATGIVGGEVQINCLVEYGPNYEMSWDFKTEFVYIMALVGESYPLGTNKYYVHKTGMNFILAVKDLSLEDGGEYTCTSYRSEATAVLVVLDTPSITLNPPAPIDGETAKVTCEARFGGPKKDLILPYHYPNLKMTLNDSSPNEMVTANDTSDIKKYYLISMTENLTVHARMNKRDITCEIGTAEPLINTSAVAVLNVLYSVRDIYITPDQERYNVGDTITCITDSNPAALYEWKKVQGGSTIYENVLKITDTMIGENNWECVARNLINGKWSQEIVQSNFVAVDPTIYGNDSSAVTIAADPSTSGNDGSAVTIAADPFESENYRSPVTIAVVTVIIVILVIIAAAAFIFRKKILKIYQQKSRTHVNATNPQELVPLEAEHLANNRPELESVEAEKLLANNLLEPGSVEAENLLDNNLQELGSVEAEHLLAEKTNDITSLQRIILLTTINSKEELDLHGKEILRVLQEDGKSLLEKYPDILNGLIQKAANLIDSEYYEDIIKVVPHGGEDSPLKYLLGILRSGEENFKKLFKDQKKLMSVIQIIASYGNVQYRTQCLNYIMIGVSFSGIKCKFEWSEEYLSTVKDLLAKGADPTWIHPKMLERKKRTTAQNQFFFQIFFNLWEKNKLHGSLLQVVPLMLSKKCNNNELLNRTLLHEFVAHRWNYIATNLGRLPPDFFYQFKNILREILRHNGTLLVQRDMLGRTPLQYFLIFIVLDESIFGDVREIIQLLQSPEVLSVEDDKWQTALHYLAKNFPVIQGEVTQSGKESLLELVKNFASQSNVCSRDEDGRTALHLLVLNPNYSELFLDVVKILKTASNIKDAKKLTPLEILLRQYPSKVSESSVPTFLDTVKFLNTHTDTNLQYKEGTKALHTIATQFGRNLPLYSLNIYCEFFQILASKRNVTFQDERGQTALHILARKFPSEISEESRVVYQNVMKHLATYDILEKKDKNGQTALHILAGKLTFEISTHVMETFLEVIKTLAVPSNICIQNPQGLTAFKIISQRYGNEVPEHCKDKFQEISEILSENN